MSSQDIIIQYNIEVIIHLFITKIVNKIYEYDGIIYGGFVRDSIIADYYKSLYDKKFKKSKNYYKNYWNKQFDLETLYRTLIPTDINICMYNKDIVDKMLKELNDIIINDFGTMNVNLHYKKINNNITNYNINNLCTNDNIVYIYKYNIIVGYIPYIFKGSIFDLQLNVVICKNTLIRPPFNKLDFLCNAFIMTREGIHISNNTGIEMLDNLTIIDKKKVEYKIIKDIVNFTTDYCINFNNMQNGNNLNFVNITKYVCTRIENMINKSCKWQINNLPIIIEYPKKHSNTRNICNICYKNIKKIDCIVKVESNNTTTKGSIMHKKCFLEYIYNQIDAKLNYLSEDIYNLDDSDEFYVKCPMKNILDFNIKNSSEIIIKYLQ